jgi:hypothetical protein
MTTRPCTALKVRAAPTLLPTLFPSSTGSRLSPSPSRGAIHDMAQTGRSNVRYVDPQRRYTVVLGPSWNAPFEALPHDDRAGTHDSADGRCGSYASTGRGQAALWITACVFPAIICSRGRRQFGAHVHHFPRSQYRPLQSRSQALPNRGALASGRVRGVLRGQGSQLLRCGISTQPMTAVGHQLPLGAGAECVRYGPMSGP